MPFQTLTEIRQLLKTAGLRPQRSRGQHFLIDRNLMQKLIDAAELARNDVVLEVGSGTGSLTNMLAERAGHVIAVEIDTHLAGLAEQHLAHHENVTLLVADVLESKHRLNKRLVEMLGKKQSELGGRCVLAANLPYDVASPIVANLLIDVPQVRRLCFTVQKELADRMTAAPSTSDYGPLSVIVQALGRPKRIARVPRQAFWPMPEVTSAIVRVDACAEQRSAIRDLPHFVKVVHRLFFHRRKTLWQNLKLAGGKNAAELGQKVEIDLRRRPETLSPEEWVQLAESLRSLVL